MKFCPECGSMMMPKEENKRRLFICSCGHTEDAGGATITQKNDKNTLGIEVIEHEETGNDPKTEAECPKCKHEIAYTWDIQTRAADEPTTRFYRCEKCKHTWREY